MRENRPLIKPDGSYIVKRMKFSTSPGAMGGALRREHDETTNAVGVALFGALGFAAGVLVGLVAGGLLGDVDSDRVRRAMRHLRSEGEEGDGPEGPDRIESDLLATLESNPATQGLNLQVHALGGGLVEITGVAPDQTTRELAGELARGILGSAVVVNRILVDGTDTGGEAVFSQ